MLIYISFFIVIIKCQEECPRETPIKKGGQCVLEFCSKFDYDEKICTVSNSIIKRQWLNDIKVISTSSDPNMNPNAAVDGVENMLLGADVNKNSKIFFSLEKDGNGYNNNSHFFYFQNKDNQNFLYNNYNPCSQLATINSHRIYYSFSNDESLQIFDLDSKIYSENILSNILGNEIKSEYNSLMTTLENDILIYAYLTTDYKLVLQKIKLLENGIEVIQTLKENQKTLPRNSCRCQFFNISTIEYIECLTMNETQFYNVRLYYGNLTFIEEFPLEQNRASIEKAFYSYHNVLHASNGHSLFIYYNANAEDGAKPILYIKKLENKKLININTKLNRGIICQTNCNSYKFSDRDNAMARLADGYFVLVNVANNNNILIVILLNYIEGHSLLVNIIFIPWKELYGINYYSSIYAFHFNTLGGIGFIHKEDNLYINSFVLFGYANSTDPLPVNNIFMNYVNNETILYSLKPSDYVILNNNIFAYSLSSTRIVSFPNKESGFEIRNSNNKLINVKDDIKLEDNIFIYYTGDLINYIPGIYEIIFTPLISEAYMETIKNNSNIHETFGEDLSNNPQFIWVPEQYFGREISFKYRVLKCYNSCLLCTEESTDELDHKCKKCKPGFYYQENEYSNNNNAFNCYNKAPDGYYFDSEKKYFTKCSDICKTCYNKSEENKHNCLSCYDHYLLYPSSNCLQCKKNNLFVDYTQSYCISRIQPGYYLNSTEYNTIDKCHPNCGDCNKGPEEDNMNCEYCLNENNLYSVENTKNCQFFPYEGYYLDILNIFRKCHPFCKTCSIGPNEGNMNCDICNKELGYFKSGINSKNCEFKEIEKMYYVEENDTYLPCYENCLYCFDKEINTTDNEGNNYLKMNCISCNETANFFLFTKNGKNCLNCKALNKYVNFQQTGCINDIPEGYFLLNGTTNEIDKCYTLCKSCHEKGLNSDNMKCDSCYESEKYFLLNGNCVLGMTCPNFFYYKNNYIINNETYLEGEKECLNNKEECPHLLPFYLNNSFECISSCPLESIFGEGCSIANIEGGLNQIFSLIYDKYKKNSIDFFEDFYSYVYNDKFDFVIKIKLFEFEGKTESKTLALNQSIKRIDNDGILQLSNQYQFEEQGLNLEKCLGILNDNNITNNDTKLIMMKIDIKNLNLNNSQYFFKLFSMNNNNEAEIIDLSICNSNDMDMDNLLVININDLIARKGGIIPQETDIKEDEYNSTDNTDQNNEDNTNENNKEEIYTYKKYNSDKCAVTYNEYGADIILEDRIALYNEIIAPNDIANEEIGEISYSNNIVTSTYQINTTIRILETNSNTKLKIYLFEICPQNYQLVNFDFNTNNATCLRNIFFKDMINDINITNLITEYTYMNKTYIEIENITIDTINQNTNTFQYINIDTIKSTDTYINQNQNTDNNINQNTNTNNNNRNSQTDKKLSTNPSSEANIKYMKCIKNISKQFKKNYVLILLMIIDIIYLACIIIYFVIFRKKFIDVEGKNTSIGLNKIFGIKGVYPSYKFDQNGPKTKEIRTYKKNMFSSINSDIQSINNNVNNKNKNNIKNKKPTTISEELTNRQNNNNHIINYNLEKINNNYKEPEYKTKKDYDLSEFLISQEKDERNILELFLSISKKKQIYIFAFINDGYIKLFKLSLIPFSIVNYFTTNVFFFNDKVIHQIYLDKGSYNFSYQLRIFCLASLISSLFLYLGKYIFIVKRTERHINQIIKYIDYAFVIIFFLFVFYWLYVGSYTSVFIKSQKHIFINFLLTIITCTIYEIILTIIAIILRKISLNKNMPSIYKISVLLILLKG